MRSKKVSAHYVTEEQNILITGVVSPGGPAPHVPWARFQEPDDPTEVDIYSITDKTNGQTLKVEDFDSSTIEEFESLLIEAYEYSKYDDDEYQD